MTKEELLTILDKNIHGTASAEEKEVLDRFLANRKKHSPRHVSPWDFTQKEKVKIEMYASILTKVQTEKQKTDYARKRSLRVVWSAAAALAIFLGASWFFTYESALDPVTYITKTTQRGQKVTLTLSDGSVVKLNSESSITYPETWTGNVRDVRLEGEAFFSVKKNPEQPFIIHVGDLNTTVLGTSFSINAYPEKENITVTVLTGRVKLEAADNQLDPGLELTPGLQGLFAKGSGKITQSEVDVERSLAWKDNIIRFDRIPFKEALRILERWYDVQIVLDTTHQNNCLIEGSYENENLTNILESMKFLGKLEYEFVSKKKIKITGNACKK